MNQLEELKAFVSERLHAAASEILGAIEKTVTDYEEQACRLKEENDRHRSVLDLIIKTKLPQTGASTPAAAGPVAKDPSPPPSSQRSSRAKKPPCQSNDLQCVFTSRTDFLKFAAQGNCPYCFKGIEATEKHLMKRHYLFAVHFTEKNTEKFVVPCMCKDLIQGRSHWHCPYCRKILYRKCNFEMHIMKMHGYTVLQQSQDAEMDQPSVSAFEDKAPLCHETWFHQDLAPLEEDQQVSVLFQVKQEQEIGEQSMEVYHEYVDPNEMESSRGHPLPLSSTQTVDTSTNTGVCEIREPAGKSPHITEDNKSEEWKNNHTPCLKALNSRRKRLVKRSSLSLSSNKKKQTQSSTGQNNAGSYCCKVCGKTFHYMYTLRTHVQRHTGDQTHGCGLCGKHLKDTESLVQHIQTHTKRNKCGICGKQFSNKSRLNRHKAFHKPKGLNVLSSV